jgi:hypothetical protein
MPAYVGRAQRSGRAAEQGRAEALIEELECGGWALPLALAVRLGLLSRRMRCDGRWIGLDSRHQKFKAGA